MANEKVCVIGLGYVGLPLAVAFHSKGFEVIGYDLSAEKVEQAKTGKYEFKIDTESRPAPIKATNSPKECIPESDYLIICVPTPLKNKKTPDLTYVRKSCETIKDFLRKGQTVILESTTYPGTTEDIVKPILEKSGLKAGTDFGLAYSPERIDPGNKKYPIERVPKIVGAINKKYLKRVSSLYSKIIDKVIEVESIKIAEATKIVENTFRAVNISMVNELAILFGKMGIDTYKVVDAASTKPFGFMPFYPGPGVGGHCIPVDPFYLSWKAGKEGMETEFIELAGRFNMKIPEYITRLISKHAGKNSKILILGVAYKKNVSDTRNSPAKIIIRKLKERGNRVSYHDPFVKGYDGLLSVKKPVIEEYDCIVLLTDHDMFDGFRKKDFSGKTLIDTRNFFKSTPKNCKYIGFGKNAIL